MLRQECVHWFWFHMKNPPTRQSLFPTTVHQVLQDRCQVPLEPSPPQAHTLVRERRSFPLQSPPFSCAPTPREITSYPKPSPGPNVRACACACESPNSISSRRKGAFHEHLHCGQHWAGFTPHHHPLGILNASPFDRGGSEK